MLEDPEALRDDPDEGELVGARRLLSDQGVDHLVVVRPAGPRGRSSMATSVSMISAARSFSANALSRSIQAWISVSSPGRSNSPIAE
jgi:hypothetical protein